MNAVTLKAHFDGKHICLDEPYPIKPDAHLMVTIVPDDMQEAEREAWRRASQAALARAYGDDEPDYSNAVIRERPLIK
jgi:hypothetical protein